MKKINLQPKTSSLIPYIPYFTLGVIIIALSVFGWFLYNNFYKTYSKSQLILNLIKQTSITRIDMGRFYSIKEKLLTKTSESEIDIIDIKELRNPFTGE